MIDLNQMSMVGDLDALPLEYKLLNWKPLRQVDVSHFVGDSAIQRFLSTQERHVEEEPVNVFVAEASVSGHDV